MKSDLFIVYQLWQPKITKEAVQINSRFGKLDNLKNDKASRFDLKMKNEVQGVLAYHDFVYHGFYSSRIFLKGLSNIL